MFNRKLKLFRLFGFEVGIDYRNSQYDDIAIPRNEKLLMLVGGMSYTFRNDWSVIVDYRLSDNESNDPDFTYDRQVFTLGAVKVF